MKKVIVSGLLSGMCGVGITNIATASSVQVYANDFSAGAGSEWSSSSTATRNGESFLGASANGFGKGTVTLDLGNLASHTAVTVEFDLYIIQSWDGNGKYGGGADNWQLTEDGVNLLFTNFANYLSGNTQAYPNQLSPYGSGGTYAPRTGAYENGHLGLGTGAWGDATYRFSFTFDHTASDLALAFTSFQTEATSNEGWGLDNIRVSVEASAVPVPGSSLLLGSGLAALAFLRKRKQA